MIKESSYWRITGPLMLLAAYVLAAALPLATFPVDLFLMGAAGLYFCTRWYVKGCSYTVMLLALVGIGGHVFLETHHFLRLGLELSFACSFCVTALSFKAEAEDFSGLQSQLASRAAAIQNLEEEIGKIRESQVDMQFSSANKIEELQKSYEELTIEKSSLEILNDVLRKANAAYFDEKTAMENQILENKRQLVNTHHESESLKMDRIEIQERLAATEQKIHDLAKVEFLYKQLKAQFGEKNHVLHETRCALFKAETELQTMALEKEEQNSLPELLRVEFDHLDEEIGALQNENLQLQSLVTHLTEKLSQPTPSFAVHRTPLPAGQPSLEETLRKALLPTRKKKAKKPA